MIRDPSDGTVREKREVDEKGGFSSTRNDKSNPVNGLLSSTTSGLPIASDRAANIAKLEKSREWLKEYRRKATA